MPNFKRLDFMLLLRREKELQLFEHINASQITQDDFVHKLSVTQDGKGDINNAQEYYQKTT